MWGFAAGIFAELGSIGRLSLIKVRGSCELRAVTLSNIMTNSVEKLRAQGWSSGT